MKKLHTFNILGWTAVTFIAVLVLAGCEDLFRDPFVGSLSVGDTGPAGGTIVFVDVEREHDWDYLEAAPVDLGTDNAEYIWGLNTVAVQTGDSIGTGQADTTAIIEALEEDPNTPANYAAKAADAFSHNGYSDWFLPSKDELNLIHELREILSGLRPNQYYWSSSDDDASITWVWAQIVNSDTGRQANSGGSGKHATRPVRVIRSFRESDLE